MTSHYIDTHHWTNEDDRKIVAWATQGFSIREIHNKLALEGVKVTRNSIIGRMYRIKFKNPNHAGFPQGQANKNRVKPRSSIRNRKANLPVINLPEEEIPNGTASISLLDAKDGDCRYVVGSPRLMRVCGAYSGSGAYCREHALRCTAQVVRG